MTPARRWPAVAAGLAFFLLCFAVAAAALAPARLLDPLLSRHTEGRIRFAEARGTLWAGSGVLVAASGRGHLGVAWRVTPGALLNGTLAATVTLGAGAPTQIEARRRRLTFGAVDATLPAALVAAALGPYDAYAPGGTVRVRTGGLVVTPAAASGRIDIDWLDASTGVLDAARLGSYRARIDLDASGGRAELATVDGALTLSGSGRWTPGGVSMTAVARADGADAERIRGWLHTMAPAQPDGSFRFAWPPPQRAGARS